MNKFTVGEISLSTENAELIYRAVKRGYYKEDILMILEEMGMSDCDEKTISDILDRYESNIENSEVWRDIALTAVNEVLN